MIICDDVLINTMFPPGVDLSNNDWVGGGGGLFDAHFGDAPFRSLVYDGNAHV